MSAKPGSQQESGGGQEGRRTLLHHASHHSRWIRQDRHHPRQSTNTALLSQVPFTKKKGHIERERSFSSERKEPEEGKRETAEKRRGGEERGWRDRWSSEKQQRGSPDMTADRGGRWWWGASRFRGLDSEDPRASVGPTINQQGAHSNTAALSLQFTHL